MKNTSIIIFLMLCAWGTALADIVFKSEFTSKNFTAEKLSEWKSTAAISAEIATDGGGLALASNGWDAKFYRALELKPGRYVLYGRANGKVRVLLLPDWKSRPWVTLDLAKDKPFTDYRDLEVPENFKGKAILALWLPGKNDRASVEWIRLESAPGIASGPPPPPPPSPDALARERPNPPVVRGFMTASPDTVTTQAIADMRSWGANVFRLQINPVGCAKKLKKTIWEGWPEVLDSIDRIVADAGEQGMKVIVDLHLPPIQEIVEKRQFDKAELWKHPELETGFLRFWTDVARRLKPRAGHIWGYDLYNEPLDRSQLPWPPREWWPLAAKIIQAVREIDRDVWFIYEPGPGGMSRGFQGLEPLPDTRVIYSVHDYYPGAFTHQGISNVGGFDQTDVGRIRKVNYPPVSEGATLDRTEWRRRIAPVVEFRKKWRVPLYVGEFSVIRWAPKEDAVRWLKEAVACYEEFGWSWTYHAFREFHGWSLEHDETRPANIHAFPPPSPALAETGRAKVIKEAFRKNTFPE